MYNRKFENTCTLFEVLYRINYTTVLFPSAVNTTHLRAYTYTFAKTLQFHVFILPAS